MVWPSWADMDDLILHTVLATLPMVLLAAVTWRLTWPRWKLVAKLVLHPCFYAVLVYYVGFWGVVFAWVHQGVLGLGGHIWFSRRHGFTWYAVEDPQLYVRLSKEMVGVESRDWGGEAATTGVEQELERAAPLRARRSA